MNQPLQKSRAVLFNGLGDPNDYDNNKIIEVSRNRYRMYIHAGSSSNIVTAYFEIRKDSLELKDIDVHYKHAGKGLGKMTLNNLVKFCESKGIQKITLSATEVGSYTWARMGFVPSKASWDRLKNIIVSDVLDSFYINEVPNESKKELEGIVKFLQKSKDPKDIRKLASNKNFGKQLLNDKSWRGELSLRKEKAYLMRYTTLNATEIKMQQEIFSANLRRR